MKQLLILLFILNSTITFSQNDTIKASHLLMLLNKSTDLYKTIDDIQNIPIDYKDCYFNDSLKSILIPLLSCDKFFDYQYKIEWDDNYTKSAILNFLKDRKLQNCYDSIINDSLLYHVYSDSVKIEYTTKLVTRYKEKPWIQNSVIKIMTEIKWSESYMALYNNWVIDGKKITSSFFKPLISMHCPEAIEIYNSLVERAIHLHKIDFLMKVKHDAFNYRKYGSYCLDLYIQLLHCDMFYYDDEFSNNDTIILQKIPFNYSILSPSLNPKEEFITSDNYKFAQLKDSIFDNSYNKKIYNEPTYSLLGRQIIRFADFFESQLQQKKEYMQKRELYWKQNMPYYKKE